MRAMRSVHVVVGIAAVAISSLAFATQIEPPKPKDRWLRVDVGEITLLSDTREHVIVELAKDLWTMRAAMAKTTRLKVNSSLPTTVLVFDNEEAIRRKVMGIQTDSKAVDEPKDPEACALFQMFLAENQTHSTSWA